MIDGLWVNQNYICNNMSKNTECDRIWMKIRSNNRLLEDDLLYWCESLASPRILVRQAVCSLLYTKTRKFCTERWVSSLILIYRLMMIFAVIFMYIMLILMNPIILLISLMILVEVIRLDNTARIDFKIWCTLL